MKQRWLDYDERSVYFQKMEALPQYCRDNYEGLPAQIVFQKELLECATTSSNLSFFLGRRIVALRQLSASDCAKEFGQDVVEKGMASAESNISGGLLETAEYKALDRPEIWQACHGVLGVNNAPSSLCASCPQKESCSRMRDLVTRRLVSLHGTADPIREAGSEVNPVSSGAENGLRQLTQPALSSSARPERRYDAVSGGVQLLHP